MSIHMGEKASVFFWEHHSDAMRFLAHRAAYQREDPPLTCEELARLNLKSGHFGPQGAKVAIMVPSTRHRISKRQYDYTVFSRELPDDAFCRISKDVLVASPELCLVLAAQHASDMKLFEMCMRFCGFYALDGRAQARLVTRKVQLCSRQSLKDFAMRARGIPGTRRILQVLEHIKDRSRSPMETRLFLLLCLPRRFGGFGLPHAEINMPIELKEAERALAQRGFIECDLCWPEKGVVIEYDGHDYHESSPARNRDATKRNVLISRGYVVYTLTWQQICNARGFEKVAHDIMCKLGYRMKSEPRNWHALKAALRHELFASISQGPESGGD